MKSQGNFSFMLILMNFSGILFIVVAVGSGEIHTSRRKRANEQINLGNVSLLPHNLFSLKHSGN
jgi:hypothetical protein